MTKTIFLTMCCLMIIIFTTGCYQVEHPEIKNDYKILNYEIIEMNINTVDANADLVGFGIYGSANLDSNKGSVKILKVAYTYYNQLLNKKCTGFDSYTEDKFIFVYDAELKGYEWIDYDHSSAILHLFKNNKKEEDKPND